MLVEFWLWWYTSGWVFISRRAWNRVEGVWSMFSVGILVRTMFYPWKRIITPPAKSIDGIMRALVDNTVSRFVGFFVRLFALITAALLAGFAAAFAVLAVIVWPLLPALAAYTLVRTITS